MGRLALVKLTELLGYTTARRVVAAGKRLDKVLKASRCTPDRLIAALLPLVVALGLMVIARRRIGFLWVTSPSGKTTARLPVWRALRVVRRRGWYVADTVPVCKLTRWQGLRLLLTGKVKV